MQKKRIVLPERIRKINGSFAFIEHRFLREGYWDLLSHHELILYFFLVLVSDRQGISFYGTEKICSYCGLSPQELFVARNKLIEKNLIAFDELVFQVLSLPSTLHSEQTHNSTDHHKQPAAASNALDALESLRLSFQREKLHD